jgi:hypothetical protein
MGIAPTRSGRQWVWWFVAVLALALFVVWMVLR